MPTIASFGENLKVFSFNNGDLEQTASYDFKGDAKNLRKCQLNWAGNKLVCAIEETGAIPVLTYGDDRVEVVRRIPASRASAATFFNWTNEYLVTGDLEGNVSIWDVKSKKVDVEFTAKQNVPVQFLSINSDDKYIAAAGARDVIQLYSCMSKNLVTNINLNIGEEISDLKFSPIRKNILGISTLESSLLACDVMTGATICHLKDTHPGACSGFTFSPTNSSIFVSVSLSKYLKIHDFRQKKEVFELILDKSPTCVDMLKNDPIVFMGTLDGSILGIDLRTSAIVSQVTAHSQKVTSLKASLTDALSKMRNFKNVEINTPELSPVELTASFSKIISPLCSVENTSIKKIESLKTMNLVQANSPSDSFWLKANDSRIYRNSTPNAIPNRLSDVLINNSINFQGNSPIPMNNTLWTSQPGKFLNELSPTVHQKKQPDTDSNTTKIVQNSKWDEVLSALTSLNYNVNETKHMIVELKAEYYAKFAELKAYQEAQIAELKAGQEAHRKFYVDMMDRILTLSEINRFEHALTRNLFEN